MERVFLGLGTATHFLPLTTPDTSLTGRLAPNSLQLTSSAGPEPPGCRGPWHPALTSGSCPCPQGVARTSVTLNGAPRSFTVWGVVGSLWAAGFSV